MFKKQLEIDVYTTEETGIKFEDYFKNRFYMIRHFAEANRQIIDATWKLYDSAYKAVAKKISESDRCLRIGKSEDSQVIQDDGSVVLSQTIHIYDSSDEEYKDEVTVTTTLESLLSTLKDEFDKMLWVPQPS